MSNVISDKQLHSLQEAINKLTVSNRQLIERCVRNENNLMTVHAEVSNLKQLIAHTSGRGMGPSVR